MFIFFEIFKNKESGCPAFKGYRRFSSLKNAITKPEKEPKVPHPNHAIGKEVERQSSLFWIGLQFF